MSDNPFSSPVDHRPAGNQFTLRGLFIVMTTICVILALLAIFVKTPLQWLGLLAIPVTCLLLILLVELGRWLRPPLPRYFGILPRIGQGENPFLVLPRVPLEKPAEPVITAEEVPPVEAADLSNSTDDHPE